MYCKLAFGNVRRCIQDYFVYFLTLTFGVCLFYVFNSIQSQKSLLLLSQSQINVLDLLSNILGILTVFVGIVLGFLIVYANNYLIRHRNKEFGTYLILGMSKKNVSLILIIETIFIGILAFICGILVGIGISQILVVVTAKLLMANMKAFELLVSTSAIGKAALFYGLVFFVVILFNGRTIASVKLIDLLGVNRRNEEVKLHSITYSVGLFVVSILLLAIAYAMILNNGFLVMDNQFFGSIILGSLGTFLFFFSLSGFLLRFVQSRKNWYYRDLNMFVLRQFNSRINTNFVSMALICLMLLITIGSLGSGVSLSDALSGENEKVAPYDATILAYQQEKSDPSQLDNRPSHSVILEQVAAQVVTVPVYDWGYTVNQFMSSSFLETQKEYQIESYQNHSVGFISLSQFNQMRTMQGQKEIELKENEYIATSSMAVIQQATAEKFANKEPIEIKNETFYPYQSTVLNVQLMNFSMYNNFLTFVLADDCFGNELIDEYFVNFNYRHQGSELSESQVSELLQSYQETVDDNVQIYTRNGILMDSAAIKLVISYIVIYVGLIFLIASAAILALQQLSQTANNIHRYGLLRKIGVEEKMISQGMFLQVAICFITPLLLALVHAFVGVSAVNIAMQQLGKLDILAQILTTGGFIILIYGGYFLLTLTSCLNMIRKR